MDGLGWKGRRLVGRSGTAFLVPLQLGSHVQVDAPWGTKAQGELGIGRSGKEGCGDLKCSWTSRMLDWTEC